MNKHLFIALLCVCNGLIFGQSTFPVIANGKAVVALVPMPLDPACWEASMIIEKYLYLSTGARMDESSNAPRIELKIEKGAIDLEGYRFHFASPTLLEITGGGTEGIKNAALEFCERFIGVRFLYPGPAGERIPKLTDLSIPAVDFTDAPKYFTRHLDSFPHPSRKRYNDWYPLHRAPAPYRLAFGHSLYVMFAPSKYAASHPEFYPLINGKRYIPVPPNLGVHWQPCLSNPKVVEEAVKIICDAFEKTPSLRTYSLGQTDGNGWCECENCRKLYPNPDVPTKFANSDRSLYYLTFCNKVAEEVVKKYPDAKLSFLAYNHTSVAPKGFPLNKALVPIITYDRLNWISPERKAAYMERQNGWSEIAREICWYDYFFSNRYILPRVACHLVAKQIQEGYAAGVRHFFAEYAPLGVASGLNNEQIWGDGPNAYVTFKMLWDPTRDVDKILDDWYCTAVGKEAAPYLREYFDLLENFWTQEAQKTAWFARCSRTYLVWTWHDYLLALPKNFLDRCEMALQRSLKLAPEGDCKVRAQYFLDGFHDRRNRVEYWLDNRKVRDYATSAFDKPFFSDDFNNGIGNWQEFQHNQTQEKVLSFAANEGIDKSGAIALKFRSKGSDCGAEQIFVVEQGKDFLITAQYLCENVDKGTIPYLSAEWCDEKGETLSAAFYCDVHGKVQDGWQTISLKCTSPIMLPARLRVRLSISGSKNGRILFDDFKIKAHDKIPKDN